MKKIVFILFLLVSNLLVGQNLVTNPSFEDTVSCPLNQGQINYAFGWDNYGDSPDYFNSCTFVPDFSVPNNWGGYQMASSGNAYSAFGSYASHIYGVDLREFIGGQLTSSLSIGTKYYVSFKVSLSISNQIQVNCACNNIGAMFSSVPYSWLNPAPITNNPQVYYDSLINDTLGWTTISGSFTSDSAYQYIVIGNFFDDLNTDTLIMTTDTYCNSYYYLDDVCVSPDSLTCYNITEAKESNNQKSTISIYPNPTSTHFTIQGLNKPYNLTLYNSLCQLLYTEYNILDTSKRIDVSKYNKGLLFVRIETEDEMYYQKIIKQ